MKLLLVTDHTYLEHASGIYDTFVFDQEFFEDYSQVFDEVEVFTRLNPVETLPQHARRADGKGVRFIGVPDVHGIKWILGSQSYSKKLRPQLAQYDAVIARCPTELGWHICRWAARLGKPYMVEIIGDPLKSITSVKDNGLYRLLAQMEAARLRKLVTGATAVSFVNRKHLLDAYPVRSGTPYDFISSIRLPADEITQARPLAPEVLTEFRVVMVASLLPYKRHADLLQAIPGIVAQGINIQVHLAGKGPIREPLEQLCRDLQIEERVRFHGHIADRAQLKQLLDHSHLFVLTTANEGLPRSIIEAMARGLPVVGTRTEGVDELVRDSELYPVGDVRALAEIICALARDPQRLSEMSQYGIEVANQYVKDVLTPRRLALYRHLRQAASAKRSP